MVDHDKTDGDVVIGWIERHCVIPEGLHTGARVVLREWQREILKSIYDTPTRRAIISVGRKNGKSALAAFLILVHLCGPRHRVNAQIFSAAQSRDQAAIVYNLASKIINLSPTLRTYVKIRTATKELACPQLGTTYRALSSDATTALGLSPSLIIHDELGATRGSQSALYDALETAVGAQDNPLSIIISTQAATDADLLSLLIDHAKTDADPRTKLHLWSAPPDMDPFSDEALEAANPALGDFQNAEETRAMAATAKEMPAREAKFRNLILNQRVEATNPFVSKSIWDNCSAKPLSSFAGLPVYAGLDLSTSQDLTAFVLVAEKDGVWHVAPTFWLPSDGLNDKSKLDRQPYNLWAKSGHLETTPGPTVEYSFVAAHIAGIMRELDVQIVALDAWKWKNLRSFLVQNEGLGEAELEKFKEFRQGFKSFEPALDNLESLLLQKRIAHGDHPVMTMCAANMVVDTDPAGNRKPTKKVATRRIDGMVALTMALDVATTHEVKPKLPRPMVYTI